MRAAAEGPASETQVDVFYRQIPALVAQFHFSQRSNQSWGQDF
jgi:hypothetical protein